MVLENPVGTDGERLVDVEGDRQRRVRIHDPRAHRHGPFNAVAHDLGHGGHDRSNHRRADWAARQLGADRRRPFVGRPRGRRREAPVPGETIAVEQAQRGFGIADVECEQHRPLR